jgi:hypothetical protein
VIHTAFADHVATNREASVNRGVAMASALAAPVDAVGGGAVDAAAADADADAVAVAGAAGGEGPVPAGGGAFLIDEVATGEAWLALQVSGSSPRTAPAAPHCERAQAPL